jgi:hypothetical protein
MRLSSLALAHRITGSRQKATEGKMFTVKVFVNGVECGTMTIACENTWDGWCEVFSIFDPFWV